MIRWFFKYGAVLLLFNTVFLNINQSVVDYLYIFYFIMGSGLLFILVNPLQIKEVILHKAFFIFFILNIINVIYYLFIPDIYYEYSILEQKEVNNPIFYLSAKFIQFSLISLSVFYNQEYFKKSFFNHLIYLIVVLICIGLIFVTGLGNFRYAGLFFNENMLASLSGLAFAVLLLKDNQSNIFQIVILILLIFISLWTGSRSVFVYIAVAFIYKYGFSIKNILYAFIAIVIIFLIRHRVLNEDIDRILQWQEAITNILERPFKGYGISVYDGNLLQNAEYGGAHNAYLSMILQYGVLTGSLVIFIILRKSILLLVSFRNAESYIKVYLCIILITLFASISETLITGVNEFLSILFWIALSVLSFEKYKLITNNED